MNGVAVAQSGGGHFINFVGWSNSIQLSDGFGNRYVGAWLVENTWGEEWGLKGTYWIPYTIAKKVLFPSKYGLIIDRKKMEKRLINLIR